MLKVSWNSQDNLEKMRKTVVSIPVILKMNSIIRITFVLCFIVLSFKMQFWMYEHVLAEVVCNVQMTQGTRTYV